MSIIRSVVFLVLVLLFLCYQFASLPRQSVTTEGIASESDLMILVIENPVDRTPYSPQSDIDLWYGFSQAGHEYQIVDHQSDFAKKFNTEVSVHKVPCLILLRTPEQKLLHSCHLPYGYEIKRLVEKYSGPVKVEKAVY